MNAVHPSAARARSSDAEPIEGVMAGGINPVTHAVSVGYASEAELEACGLPYPQSKEIPR